MRLILMQNKTLMLLLVPGRDDRAFYKSFFIRVPREVGFRTIDLDCRGREAEKHQILNKAFPLIEDSPIKGSSVIKLEAINRGRIVYVVIWPTEREVTQRARDVLENQAGLIKPTIDMIAVAEDAEDVGFDERLESLRNSLISCKYIEIEKEIDRGNFFRLYILKKPKGVKLMLLVQGIGELSISNKHTIEDYVLYPYMDVINEIERKCPYIIARIRQGRYIHKKMALLVTIYKCYTKIEEMFHRSLSKEEFNTLINRNDGLRKLISILNQ